jgi:hypothetical protein
MASLGVSSQSSFGEFGDVSRAKQSVAFAGVGEEVFLEVRQLEPVPSYYEKYSSFFLRNLLLRISFFI